jgi:1-acyl-sn-glycerol-3-phosphate acyltransferase
MSFGLVRSVLVTAPLILLATAVCGFVSLVVSFADLDGSRQTKVARFWSRLLLRISRVTVAIDGLERIDPTAGYIFAANHLSFMDTPVVLASIPVQFRFLAKAGLFRIPLLGGHLKRAGHLAVPRENPREALRMMSEAAKVVRERGISLLIFPEGGRSLEGLQEFKEGAAYLAIKAGVPVVPVAIIGTLEVLPMHSVHVRAGHVILRIADPIVTSGMRVQDRAELTNAVRERIASMLETSVTA